MAARLKYRGTDIEVRVGDRVRIKRWLRRPILGCVCYIPGDSPRHPELEYEDVRQWAIRTDDGTVWAMAYDPDHRLGQPSKAIVFVERSEEPGLAPDYELE